MQITDPVFVTVVAVALGCSVIGGVVASPRGRTSLGAVCGLLLGPFGCILAALLTPSEAVRRRHDEDLAHAIASILAHRSEHPTARGRPSTVLRTCTRCAERVRPEAVECRFCGAPLAPLPEQLLAWDIAPDDAAVLVARNGTLLDDVIGELVLLEHSNNATIDAELLQRLCTAVATGTAADIDLPQLMMDRASNAITVDAEDDDRFNRFWAGGSDSAVHEATRGGAARKRRSSAGEVSGASAPGRPATEVGPAAAAPPPARPTT